MRLYAALFVVGLVVYGLVAGSRLTHQSAAPHFVYQADAWLHGHANVEQKLLNDDWAQVETVALDDGSIVDGRRMKTQPLFQPLGGGEKLPIARVKRSLGFTTYVSFPPVPSAIMLPGALLFGPTANDVIPTLVIAALILSLSLLLLRRLAEAGLSKRSRRACRRRLSGRCSALLLALLCSCATSPSPKPPLRPQPPSMESPTQQAARTEPCSMDQKSRDPIMTRTTWKRAYVGHSGHSGTDFFVCDAEFVIAIADGRVADIEPSNGDRSRGGLIGIVHDTPRGSRMFLYAHIVNIAVSVGQHVSRGQRLGDAWVASDAWERDHGSKWIRHVHLEYADRTRSPEQRDPLEFASGCIGSVPSDQWVYPVSCQ